MGRGAPCGETWRISCDLPPRCPARRNLDGPPEAFASVPILQQKSRTLRGTISLRKLIPGLEEPTDFSSEPWKQIPINLHPLAIRRFGIPLDFDHRGGQLVDFHLFPRLATRRPQGL